MILFKCANGQCEGKELTKEEKQRLRKEKKQQKKNKEKKDDNATQESGKEKKGVNSAASAPQPSTQSTAQKGKITAGVFVCDTQVGSVTDIFSRSAFLPFQVPLAVPDPVSVPTPEAPTPSDKPAKSKAELKAERRARQEAERASKQSKKGDPGQQGAASKSKAATSELQPGNVLSLTEG